MHISNTERNIVKLLFHPRVIKSFGAHCASVDKINKTRHRIEFAGKRLDNPYACIKLSEWLHHDNLQTLAVNWGVIDATDTHAMALDMILARPCKNVTDEAQLVMCTVVVDAHASKHDIQRACDHTCKIHNTLNDFYHIQCRSVLLMWGTDNTFSEVWF
jgi:hypothetical protein